MTRLRTNLTPREALEEMAEALGRETYQGFSLTVDLEPAGAISHDRMRRIALLSNKLGVFENLGHVATVINRDGSLAGWRLTSKGAKYSRRSEQRRR